MSSSDSSSSYADDPSPNPFDNQFKSLKLEQGSDSTIIQKDDAIAQEEGEHESLSENSNNHQETGHGQDDRIDGGDVTSVVWRRTNSEVEVDGPSSPSSSGYAGERGSSGASDDDDIHEVANDGGIDAVFDSQAAWLPGKRHVNEDDASISWRKRKKHFFILSHSGKPIYSRYGDEHKLAGFSATLQAIISFMENGGIVSNWLGQENTRNPATFLHAYTCLPLAYETRQAAGAILQDVADSGVLFAILMCKHKFEIPLDATAVYDLGLNFRTSESFSPICLPRYNPMAFLYAYVHYLEVDTYLMLLTTSSGAFYHLKDYRIRIEMVLLKSNVLSEVQRSMLDGGIHVEDLPGDPFPHSGSVSPHLGQHQQPTDSPVRFREPSVGIGGPAGLWHFIYRSIYLDQYISSEFSAPINSPGQQKRLYRAYQKLYASMHNNGNEPHKTQFRRDENYVLLCWVTPDFELYAAFDPLADKGLAIKTCNMVCQWVKDVENEIFLLGASPFSW